MTEGEIVELLSTTRRPRATIYLNQRRVDDYYSQRLGPFVELVRSGKLGGNAGADLLGFLKFGVFGENSMAGSGPLTPVIKAMVIESEAKSSGQLADLSLVRPDRELLVTYVGAGQIYDNPDKIAPDQSGGVSAEAAQVVQDERERQEKGLRGPTIVWVGSVYSRTFASVCHDTPENVVRSFLVSYQYPPLGIIRIPRERIERCAVHRTVMDLA